MTATAHRLPDIDAQWERVRHRLRRIIGNDAYMSWLQPLQLDRAEDGEVVLAVRNRFMRDWVTMHYLDTLSELWRREDAAIERVNLVVASANPEADADAVGTDEHQAAAATAMAADVARAAADGPVVADAEAGLGEFSCALDPRFTFDNFVTGKPNELAFAAAKRVAQTDGVTFNPLFLYGGVGLGKTHLLHAIAWELRKNWPHRRVLHLSAEKFMYQFIRALRFRDVMNFKELYRSVDVLLIDDVQFIADKDNTQEEFFHTFNALVDQRKQIVISGDKSPLEIGGIKERLRSRLSWGLVVDIHPTTYELRVGILQAKAETLSVPIPRPVIEFLAHKIASNVRDLEGALNRLVAHAEFVGRPVTVETAYDLLGDLLRVNDRQITIDEIQKTVAAHFGVRLNDLLSPRRARHIARARQVAMFLSKELTTRSYPEIGDRFDKRDHTTVLHAVRRVTALCDDDPSFREDVETLRRQLTR